MNITSRLPAARRLVAALCALSLAAPALVPPAAYAQDRLPALGESASDDLSVGNERRLGDQIMRSIRVDPDYLDDPILLEYLQSIWQPLVAAARERGEIVPELDQRFAWEAFLVRDRTVNAFALPGGYVGVHLGLIAMTSTRDELASVLAHELTHVTQRHIARSMANNARQSLIGLAGMILGVLAASRSNRADGANAIISGSQALATQGMLTFSRDMEREADRVGLSVLTKAGFAAGGMSAMFEKLDQSSRLNDSGGFPYLRTHPLGPERIGEARSRLGTAPPVPAVSVLAHTVAQSRAKVLMDTRVDALRRWQALEAPVTANVTDKLIAATTSGLASSVLRDWSRADVSLQQALALVRGSPRSDAKAEREVVFLQVQSYLDRGDGARAAEALKPYLRAESAGSSRALLLLSSRVAMKQDRETQQRSAEELNTWTTLHPTDATAWALLGQAWEQLGQNLRALRAQAESRIVVGDLTGGVDRLRAGQKMARSSAKVDYMEAAVIESRLREIEEQIRREREERRRMEG